MRIMPHITLSQIIMSNEKEARQHVETEHLSKQPGWMYCEGCEQIFSSQSWFDEHIVTSLGTVEHKRVIIHFKNCIYYLK